MEYRLVSAPCTSSHHVAPRKGINCKHLQLVASTNSRPAKTFNPKVVGSIPTRPIPATPGQSTDSRSITNTSGSCGLITPPAPRPP